jgi:predicted RND superfamily exporter protein
MVFFSFVLFLFSFHFLYTPLFVLCSFVILYDIVLYLYCNYNIQKGRKRHNHLYKTIFRISKFTINTPCDTCMVLLIFSNATLCLGLPE